MFNQPVMWLDNMTERPTCDVNNTVWCTKYGTEFFALMHNFVQNQTRSQRILYSTQNLHLRLNSGRAC